MFGALSQLPLRLLQRLRRIAIRTAKIAGFSAIAALIVLVLDAILLGDAGSKPNPPANP